MENVLLVISLICCIAMIVAVLIQRSEGGALGMGGGNNGLMSGRGAADTLVHITMVLAAVFFVTCLALTRLAADKSRDSSEAADVIQSRTQSAPTDLLEGIGGSADPVNEIPSDLFESTGPVAGPSESLEDGSAAGIETVDDAPKPEAP